MFPLCSGSSVAATTNCKLLPWIQWQPLLIAILTTLLSAFQNKEIDFFLGIVTHSSLCQAVIIKGIGTPLACEVDCILWESANAIWVSESFKCLAPRALWTITSETGIVKRLMINALGIPNQDVSWGVVLWSRQQHLLQMHAIKWGPPSELLYQVFFWSFLASSTVMVTDALLIQPLENGFGNPCWVWHWHSCSCLGYRYRDYFMKCWLLILGRSGHDRLYRANGKNDCCT